MILISLVSILIGIALSVFYYSRYRTVLFPGVLFNTWWVIILTISLLNPLGFYSVSGQTRAILMLGLVCFNIPCLLFGITKSRESAIYNSWDNETISVNKLITIQVILCILLLPLVFKTIGIISEFGLLGMRTEYALNINGFMSTFERIFYIHFFVFPCSSACFLITSVLWAKGKMGLKGLLIGIINIILILMISAGRLMIFNAIIYLSVSYILYKPKKQFYEVKFTKKKRWQIISIITCIVLLVIYITYERSYQAGSYLSAFFEALLTYFTGGIQLLDIAISSPESFGLTKYALGSVFIAGFLSIFILVLYYVPGVALNLELPTAYAQQYLTQSLSIGPNHSINAFATMYYYFIRDFGFIGVILLTTLFSMTCLYSYKLLIQKTSLISTALFIQVVILIFYSVIWWEPYRMEFWAVLLNIGWLVPFLTHKIRVKFH